MTSGRRLSQEEFISKAKEVHGDKYDYSKVNYTKAKSNVCIICPIHGEFWQRADNHLHGKGCPICGHKPVWDKKKGNTEEFIMKAIEVHGNKYDYSKVKYVNNYTKVCIICPIHGEFWQTPANHLHGRGCPKCKGRRISEKRKSNKENFVSKAREIHGDKYDYSLVCYINSCKKVKIICPEHGIFLQSPNSHLQGKGCPYCSGRAKLNNELFIERAKIIHGEMYDYSQVEYNGAHVKVAINCKKHGLFMQTPTDHLSGKGCPKCKYSKGELKIEEYLNQNNIEYISQYKVNLQEIMLFSRNNLKIDFYLPQHNTFIEFNGIQHYRFIPTFHKTEDFFQMQIERDKRLKEYCKKKKIKFIEIKYTDIDNIDRILSKKLKINNGEKFSGSNSTIK